MYGSWAASDQSLQIPVCSVCTTTYPLTISRYRLVMNSYDGYFFCWKQKYFWFCLTHQLTFFRLKKWIFCYNNLKRSSEEWFPGSHTVIPQIARLKSNSLMHNYSRETFRFSSGIICTHGVLSNFSYSVTSQRLVYWFTHAEITALWPPVQY